MKPFLLLFWAIFGSSFLAPTFTVHHHAFHHSISQAMRLEVLVSFTWLCGSSVFCTTPISPAASLPTCLSPMYLFHLFPSTPLCLWESWEASQSSTCLFPMSLWAHLLDRFYSFIWSLSSAPKFPVASLSWLHINGGREPVPVTKAWLACPGG